MASRKQLLESLKIAGYHKDDHSFLRLYTENRISYAAAQAARTAGIRARQQGLRCTCHACTNRPLF